MVAFFLILFILFALSDFDSSSGYLTMTREQRDWQEYLEEQWREKHPVKAKLKDFCELFKTLVLLVVMIAVMVAVSYPFLKVLYEQF